jgi:hypothetical protein
MSEVKRYDCGQDDRGFELGPAHMKADPDGDWVRYEDYAALQQENAQLREEVAKLKQPVSESYPHLFPAFLAAMNGIGQYGAEKYGKRSFQARAALNDRERDKRTSSQTIADHAADHFNQYLAHTAHDHFGTDVHQLAAVAFNAMMEYYFAGLDAARSQTEGGK